MSQRDTFRGNGGPRGAQGNQFQEVRATGPRRDRFSAWASYRVIRSRSEFAFAHLQRSIVVDEAFRKKWQDAFAAGETVCEGLGAVHLLSHGIWAFKVNAAGERTDLVYAEPLADFATRHRYADGLVLTEWKKAATAKEAARKFEEAWDQARRYAQGVLAGNELTSHRYAVVSVRRAD